MKKITTIIAALFLSLTIAAQNTITTDSILQLSTCAGGNVLVPFTATGNYVFGNQFIAQLSDQLGQFTSPVDIGQIPFNTGFIFATIPQNTNFSIFYKIRVISTDPSVIGTPCPNNLIITQIAQLNQIITLPNDTICQGDSATLTMLSPAASYLWSTGDTTQSITVSQSGIYSITTTDILTCESTTSDTIVVVVCASIDENKLNKLFKIYPNPTTGVITIEAEGMQSIEVINIQGELVLSQKTKDKNQKCKIDLSSQTKGIYIIKVRTSKGVVVEKVVLE